MSRIIDAFGKPHLNGFRLGYAVLSRDDMQRGIAILPDTLRQEINAYDARIS